ncbi:fibronectin type III domain-containing protein [Antribacter sp. KLBMP9083]|uniref:Fibronectin type III domain-containing protein n=1 Tax=Antribacter soli TaxID=2910976 RepID=A0AA41Q9V5_9MICO|nr:fibronectin type III domain-containing protein [Antribacter soli]MCF4119363.1 fibronectin type III domain-containing protein [Antribacter soli]
MQANNAGTQNAGIATVHTYTGLTNGTQYRFRVRACNQFDCSAWVDAPEAVTPYTTPGAPSVQYIRSDVDAGVFQMDFPSNTGGESVDRMVYDKSGDWSGSGETAAASQQIGTDEAYNKTYTLTVRACNAAGCGPAASATGSTDPVPIRAVLVHKAPGATEVQLNVRYADPNTAFTAVCYKATSGGRVALTGTLTTASDGTPLQTDAEGDFGAAYIACRPAAGEEVFVVTDRWGESNHITW